jgi:uncharacterized protein YqgQ
MLWNRVNYTADISYLTNVFITEYDISKCNINVLYTKGAIDKDTYDFLYGSERMIRQTFIGNLQKNNPELVKILKDGIIEAKKMFFEANGLDDRDILSIKNDAVFVINKKCSITKFGLIEFMPKGIYTSFFKFREIEVYYYYNNMSKEEYIEVKGISNKNLAKHEGYFLQLLKDVFYSIQVNGPEIALRMIKDFYNEYLSRQLPIEYYRKFDTSSNYHYICNTSINTGFEAEFVSDVYKNMIDITYNLSILMQLQRYVISIYFNKNR